MYCYPSEQWIADRIGFSRQWVCHSIQVLRKAGFINRVRRRKVHEQFRSNLYFLGWKLLTGVDAIRARIRELIHADIPAVTAGGAAVRQRNSKGISHVKSSGHLVGAISNTSEQDSGRKTLSGNNMPSKLDDVIKRMADKLGFVT